MTSRPARPPVLLTNTAAWPHVKRGTETLMLGLARWLHGVGQPVEIVAGGPRRECLAVDGVTTRLVPAWSRPGRPGTDLGLIPPLAAEMRRGPARLIHSFLYVDAAAARLAGRPYVVSYGGIALPSSFRRRPARRAVFAAASTGARVIVCPSAAAARHLEAAFGYRAEVISNGLDTARYAGAGSRRPARILCAATPDDRRKRVEVLVDAFGIVAASRRDAELALAGACRPEVRAGLLSRLDQGARGRVTFLGELGTDELAGEYATATVSCLPSLYEAFGMVLVESLASGTPAVGANHGAIPEIVDTEVGALFAPDDHEDCARALLAVLERAEGDALAGPCRERAATFDWAKVGPEVLKLYDRVA